MKKEKEYIVTIITKKYKQDVQVKARNKNEAKAKVDELLQNTALKEALEKYQNNVSLEMKVRADRSLER